MTVFFWMDFHESGKLEMQNCGAGEDSWVPWTPRRSNQSIPKEISPEYSLEGLVHKLQYFGHLMRRADSFEKTLMLGKIEGRRRGRQSIGVLASTSVRPMNIQDWFPLGWTGWISLQSKGLSRVFSNTTVQKHQFFGSQPSSTLTSIHDHRKNHSLD